METLTHRVSFRLMSILYRYDRELHCYVDRREGREEIVVHRLYDGPIAGGVLRMFSLLRWLLLLIRVELTVINGQSKSTGRPPLLCWPECKVGK